MHSLSPFCVTTLFGFIVYHACIHLSPFLVITLFGCTAGKDFSRMFPIGSSYKRHCTCMAHSPLTVLSLSLSCSSFSPLCCLLFICNLCDLIKQSASKESQQSSTQVFCSRSITIVWLMYCCAVFYAGQHSQVVSCWTPGLPKMPPVAKSISMVARNSLATEDTHDIQGSRKCREHAIQRKELLRSTPLPSHP